MKYILLLFLPTLLSAKNFIPEHFEATYTQFYENDNEVTAKGMVSYKFPKKIRIETFEEVVNTLYVGNEEGAWYYTPAFIPTEKGQVTLYHKDSFAISQLFDVLQKGITSNKLYTVKKLKNKNGYKFAFLKKTQKDIQLSNAIFELASGGSSIADTKLLTLIFLDKRKVNLKFNSFTSNKTIDMKKFTFKMPKNVNIVK